MTSENRSSTQPCLITNRIKIWSAKEQTLFIFQYQLVGMFGQRGQNVTSTNCNSGIENARQTCLLQMNVKVTD
jgi:hypothetical protein